MPSEHDRGAPLRRPPPGKRPRKRGAYTYIVAQTADLKPGESLKFLSANPWR